MSQIARDLLELRRDSPNSPELTRLALNLIAPGVASLLGGI
ncbi:hypothetical protein OHZ10_29365 [Burkholderia arboris]|uniref:Uncharacterized protein n=1 Tax=Burkholderia arboris TaxID=488730 RepID=A0ABZ3DNB3_9BURK